MHSVRGAVVSEPFRTRAVPPTAVPGRTWALDLSDEPDALMRVLTLLRRRRCEILNVDYDAGDRHRPRLRVRVRPAGGRPDSLEAWLEAVIGVLAVTRES